MWPLLLLAGGVALLARRGGAPSSLGVRQAEAAADAGPLGAAIVGESATPPLDDRRRLVPAPTRPTRFAGKLNVRMVATPAAPARTSATPALVPLPETRQLVTARPVQRPPAPVAPSRDPNFKFFGEEIPRPRGAPAPLHGSEPIGGVGTERAGALAPEALAGLIQRGQVAPTTPQRNLVGAVDPQAKRPPSALAARAVAQPRARGRATLSGGRPTTPLLGVVKT